MHEGKSSSYHTDGATTMHVGIARIAQHLRVVRPRGEMVLEHVEPREAQMRSDDTDAHPQVRSERHPADAVCYVEGYEDAESAGVDAPIRGGDDIIKAEVDADYKQLAAEDKPVVVVAGVAVNGWRHDSRSCGRGGRADATARLGITFIIGTPDMSTNAHSAAAITPTRRLDAPLFETGCSACVALAPPSTPAAIVDHPATQSSALRSTAHIAAASTA